MNRARAWIGNVRMNRRCAAARRGTGLPWRAMARVGMVTSAAALAASLPGAPAGMRFGMLLAFVCTAPGTALLGALEPATARVSPAVVLACGLALGAVTAQILSLLGAWSPPVVMAVAGVLCLVTLIALDGRRR